MGMKAFLMQNLSPVALLGFEIYQSQNFAWKKGTSHQIQLFTAGKWA